VKFNEQLYDKLYNEAEELIKLYNPCQIENGICLRARKDKCKSFCCHGCKHLTEKGCSANKPLPCKIWFCYIAFDNLPDKARFKIQMLKNKIVRNYFDSFRYSKDEMKMAFEKKTLEKEEE
jgi:hypothetical protein